MGRILALTLVLSFILPPPSYAIVKRQDTARFTNGFMRVLTAPLAIPLRTLQGTFNGPPIVGTLLGAASGTLGTVASVVGGTFDMAGASAPYAKYAALAL